MSRLARRFANWSGRPAAAPSGVVSGRDDVAAAMRSAPPGAMFLPFGLGRSYGDVCLNAGGVMIESRPRDRFIAFDRDAGILRAESGVTIGEVIDIALPSGWFPPVVPGTRHVTLGGALANDVHGKNHHRAGTFGRHVARFELLRSDGPARICEPGDPLFEATVGGMGLTGFITWIELRLARVAGPWLVATDRRFDGLDAYFESAGRLTVDHEHVVAWVDAACTGGGFGRGVLSVADHAPADAAGRRHATPRLDVPLRPPVSLVAAPAVRAMNALRLRRRPAWEAVVDARRWLFPLDGIGRWNRLYGPRGFVQFQGVVPAAEEREAVTALLRRAGRARRPSTLAVLKRFGALTSPGPMSFPRAGTTLSLDFAHAGAETDALLADLHAICREAGGHIYAAKDASAPGACLSPGDTAMERFRAHVDPRFASDLWRRLAGTAEAGRR